MADSVKHAPKFTMVGGGGPDFLVRCEACGCEFWVDPCTEDNLKRIVTGKGDNGDGIGRDPRVALVPICPNCEQTEEA